MDDSKLKRRSLIELFAISIIIGVLAGIFSWLFRLLIGFIHNAVFLAQLNGHYDANAHTPESAFGWLIIFVPVLGGLVVVFLVKNFAPEAKGHGVPEVMNAIYHKRGLIPPTVSLVKALASAVTIGTGGSLGREGPIVQISAAFSSFIGQLTRVTPSQRNLMIACGAGAGIAATFNAPLGGILFAIELLLVSINSRTILPVAIATVISANVGRLLIGNEPAFAIPELLRNAGAESVIVSLLAVPLGGLIGLISIVFIKSIYFSEDMFEKYILNPYLRHTAGTLVLGIMFYSIYLQFGHYYVQGVGYATIQDVLLGMIGNPGFLLFLLIAKLIATNLTIGSGGSGGVFSPSLFLGAVSGALFGSIINILFPGLGLNPLVFVIAGMAAMVSGTTSAPLTAIIMVYEMTQDYAAILPVVAAVGIAYAVRRHLMSGDIYTLKLNRRGQLIPEEMVADLKSHLVLDEVASRNIEFLDESETASSTRDFICMLKQGRVTGIVDLRRQPIAGELPVTALKKTRFVVFEPGTTAATAVMRLHQHDCDLALICREGQLDRDSVVGIVSSTNLIHLIADVTRTLR